MKSINIKKMNKKKYITNMYIVKLIKEIKVWLVIRDIVKKHENEFNALDYKIDWVGRIYTNVNIPDEIVDLPDVTKQDRIYKNIALENYIKDSLLGVTNLMNKLNIGDLIEFPDYERFEGTDTILLVLRPYRRYFKLGKILLFLLALSSIITGIVFLIKSLI